MGDFHDGTALGPGIYAWNGELHVDARELCEHVGLDPDDPASEDLVERVMRRIASEQGIPVATEYDR